MKNSILQYLFVATLAVTLFAISASAQDMGKIYYGSGSDHGTNIEFPDFSLRVNLNLQGGYRYTDFDNQVARGLEDTSSFDVRLARLILSGDTYNGNVSYRLQNDFVTDKDASGNDDSELKDAWLQYNSDLTQAKIRLGQFITPLGRQRNVVVTSLQFVNRSAVSSFFTRDRDRGIMVLRDKGGWGVKLGVFNGDSEVGGLQEGLNNQGLDNRVLGSLGGHMNFGDYGSRTVEGDHREGTRMPASTLGASVELGQGKSTLASNTEMLTLNVDVGFRSDGLSLQGEVFYRNRDADVNAFDAEDIGFYVQAGQSFSDYETAFRFGFIDADNGASNSPYDSLQEYSLVVNKFLNGQYLKIQNQLSWVKTNLLAGNDTSDFRYELLIAAYL